MKNIKNMVKHIFPREFFVTPAHFRALLLAVIYIGVLICQLFTYEKFPDIVAGYGVVQASALIAMIAALIILAEAASLPFLISMRMSDRWHAVSRSAVIAVPLVWLVLGLWMNIAAVADKTNSGLFGATIVTPVQLWIVALAAGWLWAALLVVRELPRR